MSKICNHCGTMLNDDEKFCANCGAKVEEVNPVVNNTTTVVNNNTQTTQTNPTGAAQGQKTNGMAIAAMVCGIVGLIILPIWLGITALCLAIAAKNRLKVFPQEKGKGMATAGLVLGIIDIAWGIFALFISLVASSIF